MQQFYDDGISWGEAKEILFNSVNQELQPIRSKYEELSKNKERSNFYLIVDIHKTYAFRSMKFVS